jgi:hypothetical protein
MCLEKLATICETIGKVKLSLFRPWRPLGLLEVEALTFSDIRLIDLQEILINRKTTT